MCIDIKTFYLNKCVDRADYIMIHLYLIPEESLIAYNIKDKVYKRYNIAQVTNVMYGLP